MGSGLGWSGVAWWEAGGRPLSWKVFVLGEDLAWSPGKGKLPLSMRGREVFVTPLQGSGECGSLKFLNLNPKSQGLFCPLDPNFSLQLTGPVDSASFVTWPCLQSNFGLIFGTVHPLVVRDKCFFVPWSPSSFHNMLGVASGLY